MPSTNATVTAAAPMFAHRAVRCGSRSESRTIAIGTSATTAATSRKPGVIWIPSAVPARTCWSAPGLMNERMSAKTMLSMTKTHAADRRALVPTTSVCTMTPSAEPVWPAAAVDVTAILTLLVSWCAHHELTLLVCQEGHSARRVDAEEAPCQAERTDGERRETLNRERVLRTAMALADERGIEALTMRELAGRLGVEAASLYNHVSGKDDLLAGMADLVIAEIELPSEATDWREAMRRRAMSARAAVRASPLGGRVHRHPDAGSSPAASPMRTGSWAR